jgi:hypothetical protein
MLGQRLDRYNAGGSRYASDQLISSQNASKIAANTTKVFKGIKSCTPEKP